MVFLLHKIIEGWLFYFFKWKMILVINSQLVIILCLTVTYLSGVVRIRIRIRLWALVLVLLHKILFESLILLTHQSLLTKFLNYNLRV